MVLWTSATNGHIRTTASFSHYLSCWKSASTATATERPALFETPMASTSTSQTIMAKERLPSAAKASNRSWARSRSVAGSLSTQTCCRCISSLARRRHGRLTHGGRSCRSTTATGSISMKVKIGTSTVRPCSSRRRRRRGRPRANTMRANYPIENTTCIKRTKKAMIIARLGSERHRGRIGLHELNGLRRLE